MDQQLISERTGFDSGELFEDTDHVREYFTVRMLRSLTDRSVWDDLPTQDELDEMASLVIENGWHINQTKPQAASR